MNRSDLKKMPKIFDCFVDFAVNGTKKKFRRMFIRQCAADKDNAVRVLSSILTKTILMYVLILLYVRTQPTQILQPCSPLNLARW